MKKFLLTLSSVALLATMNSCTNEEIIEDATPRVNDEALISFSDPVTISHGDTKAAIEGTSLPSDGTLGIFAEKTTGGAAYITNKTLNGYGSMTNSTFTGTPTNYYWPGSESLDFYAYFYLASSSGITVTSATDISYTLQSTWTNQVDLLYTEKVTESRTTGEDPSPVVPLAFKHAMARVCFKIKSSTNPGAELQSVMFNDNTVGTFSIKGKAFTTVGTPVNITISGTGVTVKSDGTVSDTCLESLVFPTGADTWAKAITVTIDGETFAPVTLSDDMLTALEAGKKYTYTINYTGKAIVFGQPTVTDWTSGSITDPVIPVQ